MGSLLDEWGDREPRDTAGWEDSRLAALGRWAPVGAVNSGNLGIIEQELAQLEYRVRYCEFTEQECQSLLTRLIRIAEQIESHTIK